MTVRTEIQTIILSAGAQRPDNIALPLPKDLHGAAAKMAVTRMINHCWLQEVDASSSRAELLWRETGDDHGTTLVVTDAGLLAIGIVPEVAMAVASARKAQEEASTVAAPAASKHVAVRNGTKQAHIITLLQRPEGATIAEIVAATRWTAHTAKGVISGTLKKKLGLAIGVTKVGGRESVHRID